LPYLWERMSKRIAFRIAEQEGDTDIMKNQSYNTLIAGVIGSGKSYTEKSIIKQLLNSPDARLVLIDPKKVELMGYRYASNCLWYADDEEAIYETLCNVYDLMESRFQKMKAAGQTETDDPHIFVFIDEMAFLMQSRRKKEYVRMLNQITLLGRAAHIHLILCTQVATQDVIPACIRDNMTNIVCLRQRDAGKYRYLLGCYPGRLPLVGYAYVFTPSMERPEKMETEKIWDAITNW